MPCGHRRRSPAAGTEAPPAPSGWPARSKRPGREACSFRAWPGRSRRRSSSPSLVKAGARVEPGDLIVEFDRQEQIRAATERRAELVDLDGQIQKKRSEHAIARARDETELAEAERNVERATIEARKNEIVPRIEAEKNTLAVEQATARLAQLKETFELKRRAAEAEMRILEIQRERAERALKYAEGNAQLMTVKAPFAGFVVLKQVWKGNTQAEVQEGEEVRPGTPIIDIVDPAGMQVRARVSQSDVNLDRSRTGGQDPARRVSGPAVRRPGRDARAARRRQRH